MRIGLVDGRDLALEGRGQDLGGREEGLEEAEDKEGLQDVPKGVDGLSFVLRSENSGTRIWSNEG